MDVQLSQEFKAQTTKAITAIIIFILVYIILFLLAIALTALCVYLGVLIVISAPRILTILLGIGLASLGFFVLYFLLKFLFKSNKVDRSHLVQITKKEEPELFVMIDEIVKEVGTTFPKKVYLSADVNASVFYDSSFWSMFLPIKKNLVIGLGLVNTIHKDELKAILSHEFGHFSQRTMKVGSYVYNVNQVIFNMLNDDESYNNMIQTWADASGYFAIFVIVAVKITQGIRWILAKMYEYVNKSYMALSREMEFHADEIAANVTGYEPLAKSLLRMNLASHSFNAVLTYYGEKVDDNLKSQNVFQEQSYLLNFFAKEEELSVRAGLPVVSLEDLNKFNKSKLVIEDQWASHPSVEERIKRLEQTHKNAKEEDTSPANELFSNIVNTQEQLTNHLFANVQYKATPTVNTLHGFQDGFKTEFEKSSFPKLFNGYYDNKNPTPLNDAVLNRLDESLTIEELFSDEKVNLVYTSFALLNDMEIIDQISKGKTDIKTFDYDGKKYQRKAATTLWNKLQTELASINEEIQKNDIRIFQFFKQLDPAEEGSGIEKHYTDFFNFEKEYKNRLEVHNDLSTRLQFINFITPADEIQANFRDIKLFELKLKQSIEEMVKSGQYDSVTTDAMYDNFQQYLSKEWEYFGHERYFDKPLTMFFQVLNDYQFLLNRKYMMLKKDLLDYKETMIQP